jgi:RNA polymerase sigma-70 factor (ECF subfamily)
VSEAALIRRAQAGDEAAFTELICRHQLGLLPLAIRLTGNAADGEEAVQDALVIAFRRLAIFRGDAKFSTWLYRITVRAALARRRRSRARAMPSLEEYLPEFNRAGRHKRIDVDFSGAATIEKRVARRELRTRLLAALARLPERYRTAVVLCDLQELPSAEAAAILGVDRAALRQRLHRARLMLRGYLDTVGGRTG